MASDMSIQAEQVLQLATTLFYYEPQFLIIPTSIAVSRIGWYIELSAGMNFALGKALSMAGSVDVEKGTLNLLDESFAIGFVHTAADCPVIVWVAGSAPDYLHLCWIHLASLDLFQPNLKVHCPHLIAAGLNQSEGFGMIAAEADTLENLTGLLSLQMPVG